MFPVSWGAFLTTVLQGTQKCCSSPVLSQIFLITWKSYEVYLAIVHVFINCVLRDRDYSSTGSVSFLLPLYTSGIDPEHNVPLGVFIVINQNNTVKQLCSVADSLTDFTEEMPFISNKI